VPSFQYLIAENGVAPLLLLKSGGKRAFIAICCSLWEAHGVCNMRKSSSPFSETMGGLQDPKMEVPIPYIRPKIQAYVR